MGPVGHIKFQCNWLLLPQPWSVEWIQSSDRNNVVDQPQEPQEEPREEIQNSSRDAVACWY
jgi:hypothetical protein